MKILRKQEFIQSIKSLQKSIKKRIKLLLKYQREVSEFDAVGLSEFYQNDFLAPFVAESYIKIGLSFQEEQLIKCNDTRLVIGKIEHLILPEDSILEDGDVALEDLDTAAVAGLYNYYKPEHIGKYQYVQP